MQTGFDAKAAFDLSHFLNLPRNLTTSTSNFTIILYTDIPLELPKDDQVLLLQGFKDVLSPKRDDGKRFSSTSETQKTVRQTRNQDAAHVHKRVTAPLICFGVFIF